MRARPILTEQDMRRFFAPRWTVRSLFFAFVVTAGIYLLLPSLERLSAPPEKRLAIRSVQAVKMPPPPPQVPPERHVEQKRSDKTDMPRPQLPVIRRRLAPLKAEMDLSMALGDAGGDFTVDFSVSSPTLHGQLEELVFEMKDVDEPPRPLSRLSPVYPQRALARRITGAVVSEFIVAVDGTPQEVKIITSMPNGVFDEAAIRAIEHWRFVPGRKNGSAVATRVRQKVDFMLNQN
jgi:periplasmic protein TonB